MNMPIDIEVNGTRYVGGYIPGEASMDMAQEIAGLLASATAAAMGKPVALVEALSGPKARGLRNNALSHYTRIPEGQDKGVKLNTKAARDAAFAGPAAAEGIEAAVALIEANGLPTAAFGWMKKRLPPKAQAAMGTLLSRLKSGDISLSSPNTPPTG